MHVFLLTCAVHTSLGAKRQALSTMQRFSAHVALAGFTEQLRIYYYVFLSLRAWVWHMSLVRAALPRAAVGLLARQCVRSKIVL